MNSDPARQTSPLSRVVERDQWTVNVVIHDDGQGGWLLEIVDRRGNLTGWTDSFPTDQVALDAAIEAIDDEGIETFIGPDSDLRFLLDA